MLNSSRRFVRAVRNTAEDYYGFLAEGEELDEVVAAFAGGTATHIGTGAFIGVLVGWLYAIYVDAPLLPSFVLGAMTGGLVGYLLAERAARQPTGPGAVHVVLVTTTQRLITIRRYPTWKQRPLRSIQRRDIESVEILPLPVGMHRRVTITRIDQPRLILITHSVIGIDTS